MAGLLTLWHLWSLLLERCLVDCSILKKGTEKGVIIISGATSFNMFAQYVTKCST